MKRRDRSRYGSLFVAGIAIMLVAGCATLSESTAGPETVDCRLPLAPPTGPGGFFSTTTGQYVTDGTAPQNPNSSDVYLATQKKWVALDAGAVVATDESAFAYAATAGNQSTVHLVATATGKDRAVFQGAPLGAVLGVDGTTVYLRSPAGVARLDTTKGSVTATVPVPDASAAVRVHGSTAWYVGGGNVIHRVDLATGRDDPWMESQGQASIQGFISDGSPLIEETTPPPGAVDRLVIAPGLNERKVLYSAPLDPAAPNNHELVQVASSHDASWMLLYLGSDQSRALYRLTPDRTFTRLAWVPATVTVAGRPAAATLAGPCI